jgi:branched-chain amino acid transport system permease protein
LGCAYALTAFGFALIYNTTRTFHFAHGAVYTSAVYMFYALEATLGLSLWLNLVLVLALTALLGVCIDEVVYRPLEKQDSPPLIKLLSSLGAYIILVNLIALIFGNEIKVLSGAAQPPVVLGPLLLSRVQIATVVACILTVGGLLLLLRATRLGKMVLAMRDDPELLSATGVNPRRVHWLVFAVGSALAGLAGVLRGLDVGVEPNSGMTAFLSGTVAVIIGGRGLFEGAVIGALLVALLQSLAVWKLSAQWQEGITFLLLILFLLLRPDGLLGRRRRIEETPA